MSTIELKVTIANKSKYELTYVSSGSSDSQLPKSITANATVNNMSWGSDWVDISNSVTYQIMDGYQVTFYWTVSIPSPNVFGYTLNPDDGTFAASNTGSGSSDYHANQTYTLTQLH